MLQKKVEKTLMLFEFCAHFTPDRNILRHPGDEAIEKVIRRCVEREGPRPAENSTSQPILLCTRLQNFYCVRRCFFCFDASTKNCQWALYDGANRG